MDGIAKYKNKLFEKLNYEVMVGASQEYFKDGWFAASKLDLVDPSLTVLNAATMDASASGNITDWAMRSFFGRINLSWDDKYLLEANLRTDGSSRFMSGKSRWGTFPSASFGWKVSSEDFYDIKWMPNLKFRASYGALGNNGTSDESFRKNANINNYEYQALYNPTNYVLNNQLYVGFAQTVLSNALLTWENTYILNAGLDFDLFNYKLGGSIDVFNKVTDNILINLPAPLVVGNATIPRTNAAKVRNNGVELNLTYRDKIGDNFKFNIGGNFTFIDNKVVKFKGNDKSISGSNLLQEGYAINTQYILLTDRILQTDADMQLVQQMIDNAPIDPNTNQKVNPFASYGTPKKGDLLYKDTNGDGVINDNDRVPVGHGTAPRMTYGFNMGFDYKGFDFSVNAYGSLGNKIVQSYRNHANKQANYTTRILDRWTGEGTSSTIPRVTETNVNWQFSDLYIQDGDFLRISNVTLGYDLSKLIKWKYANQIRFYVQGQNLFTFTKYDGMDPEIGYGTDGWVSGIDLGYYPRPRTVLFGLNVKF